MYEHTSNGHQGRQVDSVLYRSELHFRRLLEKLPAGAYTCDAEGLITYYNQHAVQVWGRAPKLNDPVDRFCGSFKLYATDGTPLDHSECWMALALKHDRAYNGEEIVVERPDGRRVTVLAHANPIHDESGRLIGAVNALVDITDRKRAEDALLEADRSKDEFLAMLAHELRNPLAPIRNAVQILQRVGQDTPEVHRALAIINRQMRQMTRLIDDLLDIGRITANKLEIRRDRIELGAALQAAVEISQPLIEASGHRLEVRSPARPILLDGDLPRLAQVISNLLNNAAVYTPQGGRIEVVVEQQGGEAVLTVRDTGIGIPEAMLPRIFELFTQVERAPGEPRSGLGIGLTLARRVVEMHGGTITAQSDGPGTGSRFIVRVPVVVEAPQEAPAADAGDQEAAPTLRILVADDNRDVLDSMSMLLQIMGYAVQTARDGLEALEAASTFRPDVVMLDIGMPRLDGWEAARRIRAEAWGQKMVLIAATGWGQEADRQRSQQAGFDHHLVKPLDPDALMQLLTSLEKRVQDQALA